MGVNHTMVWYQDEHYDVLSWESSGIMPEYLRVADVLGEL